jgi:hypothetical protein
MEIRVEREDDEMSEILTGQENGDVVITGMKVKQPKYRAQKDSKVIVYEAELRRRDEMYREQQVALSKERRKRITEREKFKNDHFS